jgi:hypothetical protein
LDRDREIELDDDDGRDVKGEGEGEVESEEEDSTKIDTDRGWFGVTGKRDTATVTAECGSVEEERVSSCSRMRVRIANERRICILSPDSLVCSSSGSSSSSSSLAAHLPVWPG